MYICVMRFFQIFIQNNFLTKYVIFKINSSYIHLLRAYPIPESVQDSTDVESFIHGESSFLCSERELLITLLKINIKC